MKRLCSVVVSCVFAMSCVVAEELLQDGGFEENPSMWLRGKGDNNMSEIIADAAHSGNLGLRVVDNDKKRGSSLYSKEIMVTPKELLKISFYSKLIKGKFAVYLKFFDANGKYLKGKDIVSAVPVSKGWAYRFFVGQVPENSKSMKIWLHSPYANNSTLIDLDDFSVGRIDENAIALKDGGFEKEPSLWNISKHDKNMSKIIPDAARSGKLGLRVIDNDNKKGSSIFSEPIFINPNDEIKLSFYSKLSKGGLAVYMIFYDKQDKKLLGNEIYLKIPKTNDWQEFQFVGEVPKEGAIMRIWVHSIAKDVALADFDDFKVEKITNK